MKFIAIVFFLIQLTGCSSSSDNSISPLIGTWKSNCHERTDASGTVISSTIRTLNITQNTFDVDTFDHTDINCRIPGGANYIIPHTYTISENVITTDGVAAQRITLQSDYNLIPQPIKTTTNSIFRVTGVDLNFGDYTNGVTPTLDYAITYTKQ